MSASSMESILHITTNISTDSDWGDEDCNSPTEFDDMNAATTAMRISTDSPASNINMMHVEAPSRSPIRAESLRDLRKELHDPSSSFQIQTSPPTQQAPWTFEADRNARSSTSILGLLERDVKGIAYSKSLLTDGDTMVIIQFPGDSDLYDSSGFRLITNKHIVHSSKLLAAGSGKIEKLLSPSFQARILGRKEISKHLDKGKLPQGIKFILDLTPPTEDEEAVYLTTQLMCSVGIRNWYKSETLSSVPSILISGKDEFTSAELYELEAKNKKQNEVNDNNTFRALAEAEDNLHPGLSTTRNIAKCRAPNDTSLNIALAESKEDTFFSNIQAQFEYLCSGAEVAEYSPVRHRSGIIKLLQIIEDKEISLDSAPKVWTLFALAKWFDCPKLVCDYIVRWITTDSNYRIIEILPEKCLEIGMGLQSPLITRPAFAILVAEEAMKIAARSNQNSSSVGNAKSRITPLHRLREDLDGEFKQIVEYASMSFYDMVMERLSWFRQCTWLFDLTEYTKIFNLAKFVPSGKGFQEHWKFVLRNFQDALHKYLICRIETAFHAPLPPKKASRANRRRQVEQYLQPWQLTFSDLYISLSIEERAFTTPFWEQVKHLSEDFEGAFDGQDYGFIYSEPPMGVTEVDIDDLKWKLKQVSELPCWPQVNRFNLGNLFNQVSELIEEFAGSMLRRQDPLLRLSYLNFEVTDMILCLNQDQYKYLPLWADGTNDGSYGVFQSDVPEADVKFAPSGPGPAFHGADSRFSSQASSMVDYSEDSVDTSLAVDNGLTGHLDRHLVKSIDGSIISDGFSEGSGSLVERMDNFDVCDRESDVDTIRGYDDSDEEFFKHGDDDEHEELGYLDEE